MKRVIVIKFDIVLSVEERAILEAKFRKEYEEGLIMLPDFCTGFVTEVDGTEVKL